jgi:uncharacterized membrane protein YgcG
LFAGLAHFLSNYFFLSRLLTNILNFIDFAESMRYHGRVLYFFSFLFHIFGGEIMGFFDLIDKANDFVWGPPLMIMLLGVGIALTLFTGFFQFRHIGFILKKTFGEVLSQTKSEGEGTISAAEAASIAVGGGGGGGDKGGGG